MSYALLKLLIRLERTVDVCKSNSLIAREWLGAPRELILVWHWGVSSRYYHSKKPGETHWRLLVNLETWINEEKSSMISSWRIWNYQREALWRKTFVTAKGLLSTPLYGLNILTELTRNKKTNIYVCKVKIIIIDLYNLLIFLFFFFFSFVDV